MRTSRALDTYELDICTTALLAATGVEYRAADDDDEDEDDEDEDDDEDDDDDDEEEEELQVAQ